MISYFNMRKKELEDLKKQIKFEKKSDEIVNFQKDQFLPAIEKLIHRNQIVNESGMKIR